jgi:hypothetical protein
MQLQHNALFIRRGRFRTNLKFDSILIFTLVIRWIPAASSPVVYHTVRLFSFELGVGFSLG